MPRTKPPASHILTARLPAPTTLRRHVAQLEAEISALEQADAHLAQQVGRLTGIQGVGQRTAWLLLAALPELATLARGQTAALAGLAPYNLDSGPQRGQRHIAHGRALARRALYMAALVAARHNPILRPFYQRLRVAGKPAKVALVASCANWPNSPISSLKALPSNSPNKTVARS